MVSVIIRLHYLEITIGLLEMIRRNFLKLIAASPLLGLFKSRKSGASTGLTEIPPTSGTSSNTENNIWSVWDTEISINGEVFKASEVLIKASRVLYENGR